MTPLRRHRWLSAATALVVAFAWMLASNHCALAASSRPAHACCHEESPAKPSPPLATQCCEAFNVPVPEHATAPVGHFHELRPVWLEVPLVLPMPAPAPVVSAHAHAPPYAGTFAQIVLNRSLLAHAPPMFVA